MADEEKTEKPTSKKRQDARKKGSVAKSEEINSVVVFFTALAIFMYIGGWMMGQLIEYTKFFLSQAGTLSFGVENAPRLLMDTVLFSMRILAPFLFAVALAALISNIAQVGFNFNLSVLKFSPNKWNPISGMKKFFSFRRLAELPKALAKLLIIGLVAYYVLKNQMSKLPSLIFMEVPDILAYIAKIALLLALYVALVMVFLAIIDYAFQKWRHEKSLMMTKQEVKDERKNREGDQKVKARIRSMQYEMFRRRMMEGVKKADVVITNPTHLAVALLFDQAAMSAPQVVAKGANLVAERIKEVARENGVPIVENKPLAQSLYKMVEIGHFIPVELYRAVAEVLAYVYRLKGRVG